MIKNHFSYILLTVLFDKIYIFVKLIFTNTLIAMKKILIPILILFLANACKKKDTAELKPYLGAWSLVHFSKDLDIETYQNNQIIWTFNKYDEVMVNINTTLSPTSQLPIQKSGTYDYVGAPTVVSIKGMQYAVEIKNDSLFLSHNSTTGGTLIKFYHKP